MPHLKEFSQVRSLLQTAERSGCGDAVKLNFFHVLEASSHREHVWLLSETQPSSVLVQLALECVDSIGVFCDN